MRYGAITAVARAYLKELFSVPVRAPLYAVAARIGISPHTVRAAIKGLQDEGIICSGCVILCDSYGNRKRRTAYWPAGADVDKEVYV